MYYNTGKKNDYETGKTILYKNYKAVKDWH